ncbi:ribonuclease HII [Kocuria rosea]|uniref:ribonuclease HII n=1 Tax=Kocuria rosea TaxID=1275 RepID=UPI00232B946E|nr:ribonuclease HII [Kocuria rosea]
MAPEPRPGRRAAPPRGGAPGLVVERSLQEPDGRLVGGMDEVGRGALAGPVTAGLVVLRPGTGRGVPRLRDSKLLTPARREALVPRILAWCAAAGVGHASPQEIDGLGLTAALRLAGHRAIAAAARRGTPPDVVLLDGAHDWLSEPGAGTLFGDPPPAADGLPVHGWEGQVVTRVKADLTCASVAAASVLAKVERDRVMGELSAGWPQYGWDSNKGYGAVRHRRALEEHGTTPHHRLSWRLTQAPPAAAPSTIGDGTT